MCIAWQEQRNLVRIKSLLRILLPRSPMYIPYILKQPIFAHFFRPVFADEQGISNDDNTNMLTKTAWWQNVCSIRGYWWCGQVFCWGNEVRARTEKRQKFSAFNQIWSHLVLCRVAFLTRKTKLIGLWNPSLLWLILSLGLSHFVAKWNLFSLDFVSIDLGAFLCCKMPFHQGK